MLDTNVLSELLRPDADSRVVAFVEAQTEPIVSAVVFHELIYGVELLPSGARRARLNAGIETLRRQFRDRTVGVDAEIAGIAGRLRAGETRSGFASARLAASARERRVRGSARRQGASRKRRSKSPWVGNR